MKNATLVITVLFLFSFSSCKKNKSHTLTIVQTDESIYTSFKYQLEAGQEGLSGNTITWQEPNNTCRTVIVESYGIMPSGLYETTVLDRITICPLQKFEGYQVSTQNNSINFILSNDASTLNISKK
jgi:hypothetical protein